MDNSMTHTSTRAGFPSVAQDYFSGDFSFDANVITHPDTSFIMRVRGSSMEKTGIFNDDILIVDRSLTPQAGDVVVAVINDELSVRRLDKDALGHPVLVSDNSAEHATRLYFDDDIILWGVAIGNYHPLTSSDTALYTDKL